MGKLTLSRRLPPPCWRWSQGLQCTSISSPQRVRKDSTGARLIKNPGPKIFENPASAALHQCQKLLEAICHVMPDFDRELSCEVKDQVFRRCPIIKFARDVYACPTVNRAEERHGTRFDVPTIWGALSSQGVPVMASTASAPPTPIASIPRPPAFGVCESIAKWSVDRRDAGAFLITSAKPRQCTVSEVDRNRYWVRPGSHEHPRSSIILEYDLMDNSRTWSPELDTIFLGRAF